MENRAAGELRDVNYELFMLAVTFLSLFNLVVAGLFRGTPTAAVFSLVDEALSLFFLGDFLLRLFATESKTRYFFKKFGWADLLGSLPLPGFRLLRLFRSVRVIRLLQEYGGERTLRAYVRERANAVLGSIVLLIILVLEFGGSAILYFERASPMANIRTAGQALWWGVVTIATVGYGDYYPVTTGGRVVGIMTIVTGVALFGAVTGFVANAFLNRRAQRSGETRRASKEVAGAVGAGTSDSFAELAYDSSILEALVVELDRVAAAGDRNYANLDARLARIEALLAGLAGGNGIGQAGDGLPAPSPAAFEEAQGFDRDD